jgi:hypothetical protein
MAASHTHFAPATDSALPELGTVNAAYLQWAAGNIADLLDELLAAEGMPAILTWDVARTQRTINRRRKGWGLSRHPLPHVSPRIRLAPNPHGETDGTLRVLVARALEGGSIIAVLWSLACHPVSFPRREVVSAEFPGVVRSHLRARVGARTPVAFLQGFAGNVRPRLGSHISRVAGLPVRMAFVCPSYVEWNEWATGLAREVVDLAQRAGRGAVGSVDSKRIELLLTMVVPSAPVSRVVTLHRLRFGPELSMLGVSAEPVAEYVSRIVAAQPNGSVFPVGYIDEVYGYLPTRTILEEGGYEAEGFFPSFSLQGHFAPDIERLFLDAVARLA